MGQKFSQHSIIYNELIPIDDSVLTENSCTDIIEQMISTCRACAVSDVSLQHGKMAGYWKLVTKDNRTIHDKEIHDTNWETNSLASAEAITFLDMLETISKSMPDDTQGELVVIIDNEQICNQMHNTWPKSGTYSLDSSSIVLRIKQIIK